MGIGEILKRTFQWGLLLFILLLAVGFVLKFGDLGFEMGMEGTEKMVMIIKDGKMEMMAPLTMERVLAVICCIYCTFM